MTLGLIAVNVALFVVCWLTVGLDEAGLIRAGRAWCWAMPADPAVSDEI